MADFDFENPTFDPDGHGIDNGESFDLPNAIMDPLPLRFQQELNTSGDLIQSLQGELREVEFEAQKKRLVDSFYKEVTQVYNLRPDSIDHDQFRIDADGKTLYWTPGDKRILITTTRKESSSWCYQHWPRGTGRVVQMHCGDGWDSPITHRRKV